MSELQTVRDAVRHTFDAGSARVQARMTDTEPDEPAAEGEIDFARQRVLLYGQSFDDGPAQYIWMDGAWHGPTTGPDGMLTAGQMLWLLQLPLGAHDLGDVTAEHISGEDLTRYHTIVDVDAARANALLPMGAIEGPWPAQALADAALSTWLDGAGRIRRMHFALPPLDVTVTLRDFGAAVTLAVPAQS